MWEFRHRAGCAAYRMRKGFVPQRRIRGHPSAGLVRQVGYRSGLVDCEELSNRGNMGSNKVIGLVDALRIGEEALKARIGFVFGDDPLSNDRELLEIAPYAYVIKNEKNRHLNLPERVRLVTWSEVHAMSISELASLHIDPWREVDPSHCLVAHRTWVRYIELNSKET